MQPGLAEALTRSLSCGAWPQEGRVSVYVSYSDESEGGAGKGSFIVCGYAAKETDWPAFSKRWASEVLHPYPAIPPVHMVQMRSEAWRQKRGICREQCDEKLRTAIEVIRSSPLRPFI